MSNRYDLTQEEVGIAWKAVRRAAGSPGIDGKSIKQIEVRLDDELYKLWNRLCAGSYQAQPVKIVSIPKVGGGVRKLGIPTVIDRVAQTVIKNRLVKEVDTKFYDDSYAYREGKSAIDAVLKTRERCMRNARGWVVDIDIKGFFDNLDHDIMLQMLGNYTQDKLVLLYSKKFLKAQNLEENQEMISREKGTPQGGVISPVLANLYLHEAFDKYMHEEYPRIPYQRYADDIIVHCASYKQAEFILSIISKRLKEYKLELNSEKTKIVYAGKYNDYDDKGHTAPRKFTFLGYDFKPREYKGRTVYTPGIGQGAMKMVRQKLQDLGIMSMTHQPIEEMVNKINPVCRGWINYYGHSRRSRLYKLATLVNNKIRRYLEKKHKLSRGKAWKMLMTIKKERPKLFVHWYIIADNPQRAV
jgi:RNA-directed DNA polymerase